MIAPGYRRRSAPAVVLIIAVVGALIFLIWGFFHRDDAHPADVPRETTEAPALPACPPAADTDEGAARAARDGLRQLTLANLGQADITATLDAYVAPDSRRGARAYLEGFKPPFVALDSTILGWQAVTYAPPTATIRLATSDVATNPDGTVTTGQYITDVVLTWDAPAGAWRLVLPSRITAAPDALALLTTPRSFCA